jgi:hypothetical protein
MSDLHSAAQGLKRELTSYAVRNKADVYVNQVIGAPDESQYECALNNLKHMLMKMPVWLEDAFAALRQKAKESLTKEKEDRLDLVFAELCKIQMTFNHNARKKYTQRPSRQEPLECVLQSS